ncbi:MAG: IS256 family transposase [Chloroflexi bacterium]|nr:IS256 family transposase [Chloroflexota bacterium]
MVATCRMSLLDLLHKSGSAADMDFLREGVKVLAQAIMELEAGQKTGAERYERGKARLTYRNGYRERTWDTRAGTVELQIPKLRQGAYFPSFLDPRRRAEQALVAVVQEAYVHGVSTRKVDELIRALGMTGISKSEVSRVCQDLDRTVEAFRNRPLQAAYPYLWLDATFLKVREHGRVLGMALVVAIGVKETGEREVLGLDLGPAEDGAFWLAFLRSLTARGLHGVQLVISDAHEGLRKAIAATFSGASWQRCRVHFLRNALSHVVKGAQPMVAAMIRTIFAQPDQDSARAQLKRAVESLQDRFPRVAALLEEAAEDILAHMAFPSEHRRQLHSTNPLERLNKEIKRRSQVVGIFPNRQAAIRLIGAILAEQNDEWAIGRRYFSQQTMDKLLQEGKTASEPWLLAAD